MSAPPQPIHWPAFWAAFIGAPLLVTLLTAWIYLIPVFALIIGAPFYILIGLPVILHHLRRRPPDYAPILSKAALGTLVLIPLFLLISALNGDWSLLSALPVFLSFSIPFALMWSAAFVSLYRRFCRAKSNKESPHVHP